jgi:hypothetical protein
MQRLCFIYTNRSSFCYICIVKSMRNISPFFSVVMIVLMLSGTTGITLISHTCCYCGVKNLTTSLTAAGADDKCCYVHDRDIADISHNMGEYNLSQDCCSVEAEKMITVQVIRTEVQPEILPYFQLFRIMTY